MLVRKAHDAPAQTERVLAVLLEAVLLEFETT